MILENVAIFVSMSHIYIYLNAFNNKWEIWQKPDKPRNPTKNIYCW